jgi:hypothetical protein
MRELVRAMIIADGALASLGVVPSGVFAGDIDTPQERPFIQLRWGRTDIGLDVVNRRNVVIWVHDEPNDYGRVDAILIRLRYVLAALPGLATSLGHVVAVEWLGDSEDLADTGHGTITRTTSYSLVGSGQ